jgi:hypothetical protein
VAAPGPLTGADVALLSVLVAPDTRAAVKTVGAISDRLELPLTEVRRMLHRLEGRTPALVRQSFDAALAVEVWTATAAGAEAMED